MTPLGRCAQPGEVAAAILLLACPAAATLTGPTLPVAGGLLAPRGGWAVSLVVPPPCAPPMKKAAVIVGIILLLAAIAAAIAPMWTSTAAMPLSGAGLAAVIMMIVGCFAVGGVLMFLIFYSARQGHDD